jgi:hypothetical protein
MLSPIGFAQQPQDGPRKGTQVRVDSDGVQEAIAFQRAKDRADARQARLEARHPSVDYSNADRRVEDSSDGRQVKDPGEKQWKKDKK